MVASDHPKPRPAELREHLGSRVAKWWLLDAFTYLEEIPRMSTGKFDKKLLRQYLADSRLNMPRADQDIPARRNAKDQTASPGRRTRPR